jgi:hypothetical protein
MFGIVRGLGRISTSLAGARHLTSAQFLFPAAIK